MNLELQISEILKKLGAPAHLRGYKQMRQLIAIVYENDSQKKIRYAELYRKLGQKYGAKTADRTLRYFLDFIVANKDSNEYFRDIFGYNIGDRKEPTITEFVEVIVDELKLQELTRRELYEQEGNKAIKSE